MAGVGFGDKLYSAAKVAAVVDLLAEEGIAPDEALRGVDITSDELQQHGTRVSINQVIDTYRNAIALSRNRHLAFQLGERTHLSAYGLYGLAMLCCPDLRKTMDFAVKYHPLATPVSRISFEEADGRAAWTAEPILHPKVDTQVFRFITEAQIGIFISLHRDLSPGFVPLEVALTYSSKDSRITSELVSCPIRFDQPANRLIYDAAWLDTVPWLAHRTTHPEMVALCDTCLAELTFRTGFAGKVRQILAQDMADRPIFADLAKALRTTTRTLRRQLRRQGTSFRQLVDELRVHLAIKYLRETTMTNEDIAFALGFSDAANFRRAFSRWTGKPPNTYRRQDDPRRQPPEARGPAR